VYGLGEGRGKEGLVIFGNMDRYREVHYCFFPILSSYCIIYLLFIIYPISYMREKV
jgi:hypothetical protein